MRVLISGFEPFGGESLNPTALLVEALNKAPSEFAPTSMQTRGVLLPVTFAKAFETLQTEIRSWNPDVVLAFGQAGGRAMIELERVAINCLDADIPDNDGAQPRDLMILPRGDAAYFSTLPLRSVLAVLEQAKVPARISNSAGTYVCNFLLYRILEDNQRTRRRCGFIHVPFLPEQIQNRSGVPSMPFEQMKQGLKAILHGLI